MRLHVFTRKGHFNLANPSEESLSTIVQAYDDEGKYINGCSFDPEYEISNKDYDFETIAEDMAQLIEDYQKRLWLSTSREKDLEFAKWLRENKEELAKGCKLAKIKQLQDQREKIEKELNSLV